MKEEDRVREERIEIHLFAAHRSGKSELFLEGDPGMPGDPFLPFLSPLILLSST